MVDEIASGRSAAYRQASEALQRDEPSWVRRAAHYRMLAQCGLQDLIRADFFALLALPEQAEGALLDAGCGAGGDTVELARKAPGLVINGVDVSSVALAHAAVNATIQELIPARRRGFTDLVVNGSFWLGAALGALGALVVLDPAVIPPEIGWRAAFVIGGVLGGIVLFLRSFRRKVRAG